jgi:hypothetical protein
MDYLVDQEKQKKALLETLLDFHIQHHQTCIDNLIEKLETSRILEEQLKKNENEIIVRLIKEEKKKLLTFQNIECDPKVVENRINIEKLYLKKLKLMLFSDVETLQQGAVDGIQKLVSLNKEEKEEDSDDDNKNDTIKSDDHNTRYTGVIPTSSNTWAFKFMYNGQNITIGQFASPEQAAREYDQAKMDLRKGKGTTIKLNFPDQREFYKTQSSRLEKIIEMVKNEPNKKRMRDNNNFI